MIPHQQQANEMKARAGESAASPERHGWTPEEVAGYISYQLSELSGVNGHHEFERLCFHLARKRIHPNIIPSTGPVSAGGDQGSDFETYEITSRGNSPFFARASEDRVVFACSLQKNARGKVKRDIDLIGKASPKPGRVMFFTTQKIAVAARHKLQDYARGAHGIELELFDSLAISELLADPEVFWIATRFLSVPGEIFLANPSAKGHEWYERALATEIDTARLTPAAFYDLKTAVRYATAHHPRHSDLPTLIQRLRIFQKAKLPEISRRAFYEEFVASLRGLEFVEDCTEGLREYFADVENLSDTGPIEDAAILIQYAVGANGHGLRGIPFSDVLTWRRSLLDRITVLLSGDASTGRRSTLLDMQAALTLLGWVEQENTGEEGRPAGSSATHSAEAAFAIWQKMLKYVRQSPMFPLEMFARRLALLAGVYGDIDGYSELSRETDQLLAERFGQRKVGEQAFERSKSYLQSGRLLEAIDQLHVAHVSSFTRETVQETVHMPLFLAKMYSEANLYAAAKYYALASSYAALKIGDDDLRKYIYRGLAEAAANDHANGASLGFFLMLKATVFVASVFSTGGTDEVKDFEWARLHFYASILTYGASLVSKPLAEHLVDTLLPALALKDMYDETLPDVRKFFEPFSSYSDFADRAISQDVAPPFADVPRIRTIAWEQLGTRWAVEWETKYKTTAMAEGFVALLQILLTDLRNTELSLLRTEVRLTIKLHSGKLQIDEVPSNDRVVRTIFLPEHRMEPELVLGVAATVLKMVSAYPHDQFTKIIAGRMNLGLATKINPHAPYDVLFREFNSEDDYRTLHALANDSAIALPAFTIRTSEGLGGLDGIHQDYDAVESLHDIQTRYDVASKQLKHTLPRLLKDERFRSTVTALRKHGWKDWHILVAAGGVRLNFVIDRTVPRGADFREWKRMAAGLMDRDEAESDPQPPTELFTEESLRTHLRAIQLSTLSGLGFDCWQPTPVHDAIDKFLRRFNYWTDDVPHADPFELPAGSNDRGSHDTGFAQ